MFWYIFNHAQISFNALNVLCVVLLLFSVDVNAAQPRITVNVSEILNKKCIRCHTNKNNDDGLDFRDEYIFATAVNRPSNQKPEVVIIQPGDPENSYLIMKISNDPGIEGNQMPLGGEKLSEDNIQEIANWIASLSENIFTDTVESKSPRPFACWTMGNIPTTEMLDKSRFLFSVKHRFVPKINKDNNLFGMDGPAIIMLSLGYAVTNDFLLTFGRTNAFDNFEINARYRLLDDVKDGLPFSLALQSAINYESRELPGEKRFRRNAFMYSLQIIAAKSIFERFSIAFVPGILINPNTSASGEDPLITMGIGGRYYLRDGFSIIADTIPIV